MEEDTKDLENENKLLRKRLFEARFANDTSKFEHDEQLAYSNICKSMRMMVCKGETPHLFLCDPYELHNKALVKLIDRYSYNTVQRYFWNVIGYIGKEKHGRK